MGRDYQGSREGGGRIVEVGGRAAGRWRYGRDAQRSYGDRNLEWVMGGVPEVAGDPGVEERGCLRRRGAADRVGNGEVRLITGTVGD